MTIKFISQSLRQLLPCPLHPKSHQSIQWKLTQWAIVHVHADHSVVITASQPIDQLTDLNVSLKPEKNFYFNDDRCLLTMIFSVHIRPFPSFAKITRSCKIISLGMEDNEDRRSLSIYRRYWRGFEFSALGA